MRWMPTKPLQPFQIWSTFKWLTIPATALAVRNTLILICSQTSSGSDAVLCLSYLQSFIFFGFLVAGEEIESTYVPPDPARLNLT